MAGPASAAISGSSSGASRTRARPSTATCSARGWSARPRDSRSPFIPCVISSRGPRPTDCSHSAAPRPFTPRAATSSARRRASARFSAERIACSSSQTAAICPARRRDSAVRAKVSSAVSASCRRPSSAARRWATCSSPSHSPTSSAWGREPRWSTTAPVAGPGHGAPLDAPAPSAIPPRDQAAAHTPSSRATSSESGRSRTPPWAPPSSEPWAARFPFPALSPSAPIREALRT